MTEITQAQFIVTYVFLCVALSSLTRPSFFKIYIYIAINLEIQAVYKSIYLCLSPSQVRPDSIPFQLLYRQVR